MVTATICLSVNPLMCVAPRASMSLSMASIPLLMPLARRKFVYSAPIRSVVQLSVFMVMCVEIV
jgi:hypothetical protein